MLNVMPLDYKEKLELLSNIRQRIKRKKIRFDETEKNFGFDSMYSLISVKNTSEVKGYPFECYNKGDFKYALKIVPGEKKFNKDRNPSKLEIIVLKKLTQDLVDTYISPHITYYFTNFKIPNRCTALKCIDLKRLEAEDRIHRNSHVLVSEYIQGGCLDDWVYDQNEKDINPSDNEWKCIVFQVLYTLMVLENKYKLNHNDTHYGNILMDTKIKSGGYFVYKIIEKDNTSKTYYLKNRGCIPKLWDFEYAMVYSDEIEGTFPNQFVIGPLEYDVEKHETIEEYSTPEEEYTYTVPVQYNEFYDAHFFLCSLLDLVISKPLFDWILSVYPESVIPPSEYSTDSYLSSESCSDDFITESEESSGSGSSLYSSKVTESIKEYHTSDSVSDSDLDSDVSELLSESVYVKEGRLVNGKTAHLVIPTTRDLLSHLFFDSLRQVPEDFKKENSIFFEYKLR